MKEELARTALERLIRQRGSNYGALSRLIGRNPAYIQQYIKRGTPRRLDEEDRRTLAQYFGVDEDVLGGPPSGRASANNGATRGRRGRAELPGAGDLAVIPRLALAASAGPGSLDDDERPVGVVAFDRQWLKISGLKAEHLSMLQVAGESMADTLNDGDNIMVDHDDGAARLRDGIYVLRMDDVLMVKRVALSPCPSGGNGKEARKGRALTIASDNPLYPTWTDIDLSLVDIVGRVVWAGGRIG